MFAKLKKKIEEDSRTELSSGLPTPQRFMAGSSPLPSRSASESSPANSISSTASQSNTEPSSPVLQRVQERSQIEKAASRDDGESNQIVPPLSLEEVLSQLKTKTDQCHTLESKLGDLKKRLRDRNGNQNSPYPDDIRKLQYDMHRKEEEMKRQLQTLKKENVELSKKHEESQEKVKKMLQREENLEELESFQNQELAKIKHLLILSQQQLKKTEETVETKTKEGQAAEDKMRKLENDIRQLTQQMSKGSTEAAQLKSMQEKKSQLEKEVDKLKHEALQSSALMEEKDNQLSNFQERISILEQRLADTELSGDDRVQAVIAERDMLEKKLEESWQQLSEIKSSWSVTINNLESQIFNLNRKMAEDSEECTKLERVVADLRSKLETKEQEGWRLDERLQDMEKEVTQLKASKQKELDMQREDYEKKVQDLQSCIAHLERRCNDMAEEQEKERQAAQNTISQLVTAQTEHVEKEIEVERQLTCMGEEIRTLKNDLIKKDKECHSHGQTIQHLTTENESHLQQVQKLQEENWNYSSDTEKLKANIQDIESQLNTVIQEKDTLLMRNAELSQQLELLRQELKEEQSQREKDHDDQGQQITNLQQELTTRDQKVKDLEAQAMASIESSSRVSELKSVVSNLESQLMEKNKTIRLQQQRLSDMKKTLQRELKVHTGNDSLGDLVDIIPSAALTNLHALDGKVTQSHSRNQTHGAKRQAHAENHEDDDINFKYLKHVVFKYMTSREYEAQHLIKAIAVLLRFTPDEEKMIRETVEWKMSWFGSKPQLPKPRRSRGSLVS